MGFNPCGRVPSPGIPESEPAPFKTAKPSSRWSVRRRKCAASRRRIACKPAGIEYPFAGHRTQGRPDRSASSFRVARRSRGREPMPLKVVPAEAAPPHPPRVRDTNPHPVPGVKDVRAEIGDDARAKSTLKGVLFFVASAVPYALGLAGFLALDGWVLKTFSAAVMTMA